MSSLKTELCQFSYVALYVPLDFLDFFIHSGERYRCSISDQIKMVQVVCGTAGLVYKRVGLLSDGMDYTVVCFMTHTSVAESCCHGVLL